MTKRVLVDLDDCVVDLMMKWCYYHRKQFGSSYQPEDIKAWEMPGRREEWDSILRIPGFFADLPFTDSETRSVLRSIEGVAELYLVSSPPVWEACADKYRWVHTNLRIPGVIPSMGRLVLTRDKHIISGDVLVDDKPHNLESWCATQRGTGILFTQPWNRDYVISTRGAVRAGTWNDVWRLVYGDITK